MAEFPRTEIGGVRVSRLVAGSNWWLGYSHQTHAKSQWIQEYVDAKKIAEMMAVYVGEGINVTMSPLSPKMTEALNDAQQRTGEKMWWICTPSFELTPDGPDWDTVERAFDETKAAGADFCWPHTGVTDALYDGLTRTIRHMERVFAMIRERDMIPGLSTHLPQVIRASDEMGLDSASYVCIYNAPGFLMPVEIDWVQRVIQGAEKPVTTIKPMAAGRLMPYVGLPFSWATIRDCDLVTIGCFTPDEVRECIEISRACLERRPAERELQTTRSKRASSSV